VEQAPRWRLTELGYTKGLPTREYANCSEMRRLSISKTNPHVTCGKTGTVPCGKTGTVPCGKAYPRWQNRAGKPAQRKGDRLCEEPDPNDAGSEPLL
jgi:hypothetical protein